MSLKINPKKAMEKIDSFLEETNGLLNKNYSEGRETYYTLDTRIRNFISAAFSDAEQKLHSYVGLQVAFAGHQPTPQEEQEDYINDLQRTKRHLIAWKEEIELSSEVFSESDKLDKIEKEIELGGEGFSESDKANKLKEQIQEKGLESERRQKVAETKFYGAVIELLDFQRSLIREKEHTTKSIIEIKKDVSDVKEMILKLLKEKFDKN